MILDIMKVFPIIITYNIDYQQCNTYKTLLSHYPDCRKLIYDNSPTPLNAKYKSDKTFYIHDPENHGITMGYNRGVELAMQFEEAKYVLLLDQDTIFEADYIEKLSATISKMPNINVIVPLMMYGQNKSFSPVRFNMFTVHGANLRPGTYNLKEFLPVNSGTCISIEIYKQVGGYNEHIKLDFADFDFFERVSSISPQFCIIDSHAQQSFSDSETDLLKLFGRYKVYVHDAKYYQGGHIIGFHVLKHTLALTIRTKKTCFLNYYLRNYIL